MVFQRIPNPLSQSSPQGKSSLLTPRSSLVRNQAESHLTPVQQPSQLDYDFTALPAHHPTEAETESMQPHLRMRLNRKNQTGMPDRLKAGAETLSGIALDDVQVHYNSPKPAALQASAYTQGSHIHVAPGQEKHLPHEVWHVVQQKQRAMTPTGQIHNTPIHEDATLEQEAEAMGAKVLQLNVPRELTPLLSHRPNRAAVVQTYAPVITSLAAMIGVPATAAAIGAYFGLSAEAITALATLVFGGVAGVSFLFNYLMGQKQQGQTVDPTSLVQNFQASAQSPATTVPVSNPIGTPVGTNPSTGPVSAPTGAIPSTAPVSGPVSGPVSTQVGVNPSTGPVSAPVVPSTFKFLPTYSTPTIELNKSTTNPNAAISEPLWGLAASIGATNDEITVNQANVGAAAEFIKEIGAVNLETELKKLYPSSHAVAVALARKLKGQSLSTAQGNLSISLSKKIGASNFGESDLDTEIASSANKERAEVLKDKLATIAISPAIKRLLIRGIANSSFADQPGVTTPAFQEKGREGLIGIAQAERAAKTLEKLATDNPNVYASILAKLFIAGQGDETFTSNKLNGKEIESILILKAVAVRREELLALPTAKRERASGNALEKVEAFADEIRGSQDLTALKDAASVRDKGQKGESAAGLRQVYTMSCGPASLQIILGELDPITAFEINRENRHERNLKTDYAEKQRKQLTSTSKTLLPVSLDIAKSKKDLDSELQRLSVPTAIKTDIDSYLNHIKPDLDSATETWLTTNNISADDVRSLKDKAEGPLNREQPGASLEDFALSIAPDVIHAYGGMNLTTATGQKVDMTKKTKPSGGTRDKLTNADIATIAKDLFLGHDVTFGGYYTVPPSTKAFGHYMVFTDVKGQSDLKKSVDAVQYGGPFVVDEDNLQFLVSDPSSGKSFWITAKDLKNGNFDALKAGTTAEIATYYPYSNP